MGWVPLPACLCHIFLLLCKFLCFCFTSNFFTLFQPRLWGASGFLCRRCNVTDVPNVNAPRTEPPNITMMIITVISKKSAKRLQSYYCSNISVTSDKLFGLNMNSILREIKNEISLERRKTTNFFIRKFGFFRINHCMMCQKGIFRRKKCRSCVQPYPNFPCKICKRGLF